MRKQIDITVNVPQTAVDALAEASDLPKQRIKDAMAKGACWWLQKGKRVRLRKAKRELKPGTRIELFYDDNVLAREPEHPTLIEDKGRYSVWNKPHGLLSQGSQWGDHCSLLRLAEVQLNRACFLVHRLDADAAGLMLVAHDGKAAAALSTLFSSRAMIKIYRARVTGQLLSKNTTIDAPVDGKASVSHVTTIKADPETNTTLVEVKIETGRKHQIRRHLASVGHPIVGDRIYGAKASSGLQLVAKYLAFDCPLQKHPVRYALDCEPPPVST
ncbi:RluA family pseudouridine synthase [Marinobacter litoralis]|uniref:RluA family pseudouridine synthase n=1 Tax=Marinobacter litoralis TaxID=187981 RepID=UPI0018ED9C31|nr:RluA family pseudouridine synthase [Marinobacter litoralis]MBJ6137663.1 RluA family pseudouridine synthase [Marinobacter litoralis]